jgi:hypothetical protein
MSNRIFVVDTSYLLELYKIGGDWKEQSHITIKRKFGEEQEIGSQFYFPIPVLFEFANHIADADNRYKFIQYFEGLIHQCLDDDLPFFITPCSNAESINDFILDLRIIINRFNKEFVYQQLDLADSSIIAEAIRLKKQYKLSCEIHIWTKHQKLKAYEPDTEPHAFV